MCWSLVPEGSRALAKMGPVVTMSTFPALFMWLVFSTPFVARNDTLWKIWDHMYISQAAGMLTGKAIVNSMAKRWSSIVYHDLCTYPPPCPKHTHSHSQVLGNLGAADIDSRLEEQLIDGILYAFQEQTNEVCQDIEPKLKYNSTVLCHCTEHCTNPLFIKEC